MITQQLKVWNLLNHWGSFLSHCKDGPPKPFKTIQASKVQLRNTNVFFSLKEIKTIDNINSKKVFAILSLRFKVYKFLKY